MMKLVNKILFHVKGKPVKVRDVLILLLILLLLLLFTRCGKEKTKQEKIEDAVSDGCKFPKQNIKDLNDLLSSGDLCSERWFEDVDAFIQRLEDQNKALKKTSGEQSKALYEKQKTLIKQLKAFRQEQSEANVNDLERAFKAYQKQAKKGC